MQPEAVLLVNRDGEFLAKLRTLIEREGHRVVTASNADEAMERAQEVQPFLILTDFEVPKSGGVDFLTLLRERGLYDDVPKVILTSDKSAPPSGRSDAKRTASLDAPVLDVDKSGDLAAILTTVREARALR